MIKIVRFAGFFAFILCSSFAFAAGTCPSGLPVTGNNCYFIAANGSDSNSGTSESTPWLHAPGMPNCTGTCASTSPAPGQGFIFRGGDTWHFGASATPAVGGTWSWNWAGSSGSPTYIGVDKAWYSGSSWARPIMTGDNATSTSPVSSCSYQIGSNNVMLNWGVSYTILDNFELTGMCQNDVNAPWAHDIYLNEAGGANNTYEHLYIHGWTALSFAGCSGSTGHCFNLFAFLGSNNDGDQHLQDVVDGSDSNPSSLGVMYLGGYNVSGSVFRYASQIVTSHGHLWHDNLFEHWYAPGDGQAHGNLYEESGSSSTPVHAYYNNVFRNICTDSGSCPNGIVGIWPQPGTSTTGYWFNNLVYNAQGMAGNFFNIGQNSGAQGTLNIFNNTFEQLASTSNTFLQCNAAASHPFTATNNHYIGEAGSAYSSPCSGGTFATELLMNHATATASGFSATETYAFSPSASASLKAGTSLSASFCSALSSAAGSDSTLSDAAAACGSDTRYACSYDTSNHSVSCPGRTTVARPVSAWIAGAYQSGLIPPPPVNLVAAPVQ